jgi:hypothetical protein
MTDRSKYMKTVAKKANPTITHRRDETAGITGLGPLTDGAGAGLLWGEFKTMARGYFVRSFAGFS